MEAIEQIRRFTDFLQLHHHAELLEKVSKGEEFLNLDFAEISKFDPDLANILLDQPEEVMKAADMCITEFDLPIKVKDFRIRFFNFPPSQTIILM